jgi:hypothetical protein
LFKILLSKATFQECFARLAMSLKSSPAAPISLAISGDFVAHVYLQQSTPGTSVWVPSIDCEHAVLFTRGTCTMFIEPNELTTYRLFAAMFARGVMRYQFICEASNV